MRRGLVFRSVRAGFVVILLGGLTACAPTKPPQIAPPIPPRASVVNRLTIEIDKPPNGNFVYRYLGVDYGLAESALAALRKTEDSDLAELQPAPAPIGGKLRILLSATPTPWIGIDKVGKTTIKGAQALSDSITATIEHEAAAVQKSHLFTRVTEQRWDEMQPDLGLSDYVLWWDAKSWHLGASEHNSIDLSFQATSLPAWLDALKSAMRRLAAEDPYSIGFAASLDGGKTPSKIYYRGARYTDIDTLKQAVAKDYSRDITQLPTIADRLGGKALVVMTGEFTHQLKLTGSGGPDLLGAAFTVITLARQQANVDALRQTRLFDDMAVKTDEVTDVALDHYDYVLFEMAGVPGVWHFKTKGNPTAQKLIVPKPDPKVQPPPSSTLDDFVTVVRDQLRAGNAPG
jgi:hypothetical protein